MTRFENIKVTELTEDNGGLGLGVFLVERSFFPENESNYQEQSHLSKKNHES